MNEAARNDIVQRFHAGQSQRHIARDLHLARSTVQGVLAGVAAQRAEGSVPPELRPPSRRRMNRSRSERSDTVANRR